MSVTIGGPRFNVTISRASNKVTAEGSRINIFVSCNKLKGKDKDPVVLMYIQAGDQWKEVISLCKLVYSHTRCELGIAKSAS